MVQAPQTDLVWPDEPLRPTKGLSGARLAAVGCMLALIAGPSAAVTEDLESVYLDGFVDRRARETKVSGRPLVGAVALDDAVAGLISPAVAVPKVLVDAPVAQCVQTVSVDGAYWSQGQLSEGVLRRGISRLRIHYGNPNQPKDEAEIESILNGMGPLNVAVLVTVGSCQSEEPANTVVVARRQPMPFPPLKGVRLFVNARKDNVEITHTDASGSIRRANCRKLPDGRQRIVYDSICDLQGPLSEITVIKLTLVHYEQRMPSVEYTLHTGQSSSAR